MYTRDPDIRSGHIPPGISLLGQFPRPDISPSLFTWFRTSPFHYHHAPMYNIKRSTANVYTIDSGLGQKYGLVQFYKNSPGPHWSVRVTTRVVGRLGLRSGSNVVGRFRVRNAG